MSNFNATEQEYRNIAYHIREVELLPDKDKYDLRRLEEIQKYIELLISHLSS